MITNKTKEVFLSCLANEMSDTIVENVTIVYPKVKAEIGIKLLKMKDSLLETLKAELEQEIIDNWNWQDPLYTISIPSYILHLNDDFSYSLETDTEDCVEFDCIEGSEGGLARIWFTKDEIDTLWG